MIRAILKIVNFSQERVNNVMVENEYLESHNPLRGLVFSSTGLEPEIWLQTCQKVKTMGGEFDKTLTQNTHYLIVGSRKTSKYEFCVLKRPDVIFLHQSAIFNLFEKWKEGQTLDARQELFANGRYPVFGDCIISFTGIARGPQRNEYIDLVESNGGKCMGELNKQVTYLVAARGSTGDKRKYGKIWEIPAVLPEWIQLSTIRGAILPTALFRDDDENASNLSERIEKLSQEIKSRTYAQTRSEYEVTLYNGNRLVRPQRKRKAAAENEWTLLKKKREQFERNESVSNEVKQEEDSSHNVNLDKTEEKQVSNPSSLQSANIFQQKVFEFYGFDERQLRILEQSILLYNGQTAGAAQSNPDIVILNADMDEEEVSSIESRLDTVRTGIYTHWAVERSLHYKTLKLDKWGQYVHHQEQKVLSGISVGISGYSGVELLHLERLIGLLGADYKPTFNKQCSVLVCQSVDAKKYKFAVQWHVDVVTEAWLWKCAETGQLAPLDSDEFVLDNFRSENRTVGSWKKFVDNRAVRQGTDKEEMHVGSKPLLNHVAARAATTTNTLLRESSRPINSGRRLMGKKAQSVSVSSSSGRLDTSLVTSAYPVSRASEMKTIASSTATITNDQFSDNLNSTAFETTGTIQFIDDDIQNQRNKILQALGQPSEQGMPTKAMQPAADLTNKRKLRTRNIMR